MLDEFVLQGNVIMDNPYVDAEGRAVVSAAKTGESLKEDLKRLLAGLGGLDEKFSPEHRILIKPNVNSYHDAPAAVDLDFLAAFVEILQDEGCTDLAVAESSGRRWEPTSEVFEKKGIHPVMEELGVPLINLDEREWQKVETGGEHLTEVRIPKLLDDYDRLIFLPNLKTHGDAGFTCSLKLAMGVTHQKDRHLFHRDSVPAAVADLARIITPQLTVVDGREAFVADGPTFGEKAEPGVLLASGDQVACDIESVRLLLQWGAQDHLGTCDPYETELIKETQFMAPEEITVRWV